MKELPPKDLPEVSGGQIIGDEPPYVPGPMPQPYPKMPGGPLVNTIDGPEPPSNRQVNS